MAANTIREPPSYAGIKGDRKKLTHYISALKTWARVSGVEKKNQADTVKYHAYQTAPELFEELEAKFGDTLTEKEEGLNSIITYLEEKFGVSQHSEIVRKLNDFYSVSRAKGEDLVKFTTRFDTAYKECTKIKVAGNKSIIDYSSTALAVLLLRTANLSDIDHQIISRNLNFDEKEEANEKKTFENTKAAVIAHHVTKQANHTTLHSGASGGTRNLATYLAGEMDEEEEEELFTYLVDKRSKGGGKFQNKTDTRKFPAKNGEKGKRWKCDYCICDHPKWKKDCGCPCTNHTKENCPNPDPEKKKIADLREAEWRKKQQQNKSGPAGTLLVTETSSTSASNPASSFFGYLNHIEDSVDKSFMVKETLDTTSPTPRAEFLWELERLDERDGEPEPALPSHSYDISVSPRLGGVPPSGKYLNNSETNVDSFSSHGNVDKTFVVNIKEMSDAPAPVPRDEFYKEIQRLDREMLGDHTDHSDLRHDRLVKGVPDLQSCSRRELGLSPIPGALGRVCEWVSHRAEVPAVETCESSSQELGNRDPTGPGCDDMFSTNNCQQAAGYQATLTCHQGKANPALSDKIFLQGGDLLNHSSDTKQYTMVVDTASPQTIIGKDNFARLRANYPAAISRSFEYQDSNKRFEFGGGEQTRSLVKVKLPIYVQDIRDSASLIHVWVEVVDQEGVPFLLGGASLDKVKATLRLGEEPTITLNWKKQTDTIPLYRSQSGHYHILILPMSQDDDNIVTKDIIQAMEFSRKDAAAVVHFTVSNDSRHKMVDFLGQPSSVKAVYFSNNKNKLMPLSKKEVFKLHHYWGHLHPAKLEKIIKTSGAFDQNTIQHIRDLENCEACKLESRRPPKPKSSAPKSISFNHLICIDLKENIRYKNAPRYILYIIDAFTKFKAARFIDDKRGETVAEALLLEWVKFFGPPKYIQSDRGKEFLNQHLQAFCNIHSIRMTTTASYTPNANGLVERNHAVIDKMLEKMVTQDPELKPQLALCWSIQASNSLDLVDGISPFTLVFGRNPQHPAITDLGDVEQLQDISIRLAAQYNAMLQAREVYTSLEAQSSVKKALQARIYTDHTRIQVGEWIYYRTNVSRYWQGPIKVLTKDGKRLYCLKHGSPVVVNTDDVLLHKLDPDLGGEQLVTLQQQLNPDPDQSQSEPDQSHPDPDQPSVPPRHEEQLPDIEIIQERELQDRLQVPEESQETQHESSTANTASIDFLGDFMVCNTCSQQLSSKNVIAHNEQEHNITNKTVRVLAKLQPASPDSLYANFANLKQGDVLSTSQGRYITLQEAREDGKWTARDLATGQTEELDMIKNMDMRYLGQLGDQDTEAIRITDQQGDSTFLTRYTKVFFAAEKEQEPNIAYVVNIPRSRHGEDRCVAAKKKELQDFVDFDVYDIVDVPRDANVIGSEWVLVEKDDSKGNKIVKARLCARGDMETGKHLIPVNSPTANKISIKILLALAASKEYDVRSNDTRRAFLQTENLSRTVYVRPPVEAGLPPGKAWILKRACYGLVDASRSYFLRHASELKTLGFNPLQFDPATFIKTKNGTLQAAYASHVDDCLVVGEKKTLDDTHEAMAQRLTYGDVQSLPLRFLGMNICKNANGDIVIDQNHYVEELEVPDMQQFQGLAKADILPEQHQSTFRSLASKLNMLALSSRPDFTFAAKYLTTRYGKATKSDITRAVKLINRAKVESTEMIIPNLGDIQDWLIVGISDASNKSASEIFSVGGHVVMIVNKNTEAAAVVHWSSKKISRVVSSSLAAETLGLQQMSGTLYLVRKLLEGICGVQANKIPCLALTDSKNLWSCIHNISSCSDNRLQADIINIRQAIHDDQTIQEVRYIHSSEMLADCLTKQTNLTGEMLLNTVRSGSYSVPGGTTLRDSTRTSVKTWDQLMSAEKETEVRGHH